MGYPESEWERAMRVQEVMMRALSGELYWFQAADVLGVDVRTMRRWREKFERNDCHALFARRAHQVTLSYSWVKDALQLAGLVAKRRPRGQHRQRREPRACVGELLHLDGSVHAWFALAPEARPTLLSIPDDATNHVLYAQFWERETTQRS